MCVSGILFLCVLVLIGSTDAIIDYCSSNKFNTNSTYMQFTKEVSSTEYAARTQFKGLHCCSKGYRSIEWYKDNKPYPWPSDVSGFILYPEAANQTIYTQSTLFSDTGKYTCVLRNDTNTYSRDILLNVIDILPDAPKATFEPSNQEVELGKSARLFCEAFVGKVDLPDASNEIVWTRNFSDLSKNQQGHIKVKEVNREDNKILGAYLTISHVTKEDFGEYICKISNPDTFIEMKLWLREKELYINNPVNPVPWLKIMFVVIVVVLLMLKIFLLNLHFGLPLRVKFKDTFGRISHNDDNKKYDILICYSEGDSDLIRGTFIPTLQDKYNYTCFAQELPNTVTNWSKILENHSKNSRCIVPVVSPACFANKWDVNVLASALEELLLLNSQIICVVLKEMPKTKTDLKNAQGENLSRLSKSINIVELSMTDKKFWYYLRLGLPPKRTNNKNLSSNETNVKRLNFNSQESLEILV